MCLESGFKYIFHVICYNVFAKSVGFNKFLRGKLYLHVLLFNIWIVMDTADWQI